MVNIEKVLASLVALAWNVDVPRRYLEDAIRRVLTDAQPEVAELPQEQGGAGDTESVVQTLGLAESQTDMHKRALLLAEKIRVRPDAFWRMQKPDNAYCMQWNWFEESIAREYYAKQQEDYPEHAAQYELKLVQITSCFGKYCNEAADLLVAMAGEQYELVEKTVE